MADRVGFKSGVRNVLENIEDTAVVEKNALDRLRGLMREASPWDAVKAAGMAAVPSGDPTKRLQKLFLRLQEAEIFVVPVGEMEGFCRSAGSHGPRWVEEVLSRDICSDPELSEARSFVNEIMDSQSLETKGAIAPCSQGKRSDRGGFFASSTRARVILESLKRSARLAFWVLFALYWGALFLEWILSKLR